MKEEVKDYLKKYNDEIYNLFVRLRELVIQSAPDKDEIEEKLWAKLPSYYVGEKFIRLIPFKDHINVEAVAVFEYKQYLQQYNITPKGMLQIYLNQDVPEQMLKDIVVKTLTI